MASFKPSELQAGSVKQMGGAVVSANPQTKANPLAKKMSAIDPMRIQELPFPLVQANVLKAVMELGYSQAEAKIITDELLSYKNNMLTTAEVIANYEATKLP